MPINARETQLKDRASCAYETQATFCMWQNSKIINRNDYSCFLIVQALQDTAATLCIGYSRVNVCKYFVSKRICDIQKDCTTSRGTAVDNSCVNASNWIDWHFSEVQYVSFANLYLHLSCMYALLFVLHCVEWQV